MLSPWRTEPARKIAGAFLLREPERVIVARSALQQENTARYHAAATRRIRVARDLQYTEPLAALSLYREGAMLLIAALIQSSHPEAVELPPSLAEAWSELDRYPRPLSRKREPAGLAQAREILANDDPMALDALSPEELAGAAMAAAETVQWLSSAIEPRTQRDIRVSRRLRVGGAGLVALLVLYELGVALFSRKDLALNMPVTASSQRPGSPPAAGVDNGDIESTYGVHTNIEQNPWVRIDLGASIPIHEVRVHNRGDGYESEILPLSLQLSNDDHAYTNVAERTEVFTRDRPWITKLVGKSGRYVRVYMPKQGYIALSEIEVY